jgi:malonyl CoA-acyl carrier protein transacylase
VLVPGQGTQAEQLVEQLVEQQGIWQSILTIITLKALIDLYCP